MSETATAVQAANSSHAQGMMIMSVGMLILPVMDGIGKYLATEQAMSPGQVSFYRFIVQLILTVAAIALVSGRPGFKSNRFWLNILRGFLIGGASLCFFAAVKYMPIADALARGCYQVLAMLGPYLRGDTRLLFEKLSEEYLKKLSAEARPGADFL